jgi:carboxymethylenebutenolidase
MSATTERARALLAACGIAQGGMDDGEVAERAGAIAAAAREFEGEPDAEAIFDAHMAAEFQAHDLQATMATMTAQPWLYHVPVMTGGRGREEVSAFYGTHFLHAWPADTRSESLSRTVGQGRVVEEMVMRFTHDIEMPFMLPGVPPTGRPVELAVVVVLGSEDGRVSYEHIYWDQATLLVQLGLVSPEALPVTGAEQARGLLARRPSNALIARSRG